MPVLIRYEFLLYVDDLHTLANQSAYIHQPVLDHESIHHTSSNHEQSLCTINLRAQKNNRTSIHPLHLKHPSSCRLQHVISLQHNQKCFTQATSPSRQEGTPFCSKCSCGGTCSCDCVLFFWLCPYSLPWR